MSCCQACSDTLSHITVCSMDLYTVKASLDGVYSCLPVVSNEALDIGGGHGSDFCPPLGF